MTLSYIFKIFPFSSIINVILFGQAIPAAPYCLATSFLESDKNTKGKLYLVLNAFNASGES
ncbi:uncharacterized protein METZ01_LOCUS133933 [marine metagenome]|uniref:Uncharacterized protein n=1 Tax=marine metagenome TaxID=408172 RepID=A0A381YVT5_9ZZZZ